MGAFGLGKKGPLSPPATALRKMRVKDAATLLIETTDDGAVNLRPVAAYPVEVYTKARMKQFDAANRGTEPEAARLRKVLARRKR